MQDCVGVIWGVNRIAAAHLSVPAKKWAAGVDAGCVSHTGDTHAKCKNTGNGSQYVSESVGLHS